MAKEEHRKTQYREGSLTLAGTVMLGTGVMIGAGIFELTGQIFLKRSAKARQSGQEESDAHHH